MARLGWLPSQARLPLSDGWHRTCKLCQWPWNVKSTNRKAELPQHKPGSRWEDWSLPTTSQLHLYLHCMICTRVAVPKLWFLRSCLCCKDEGPNRPNDQHSLEEHLWHVASTTSTVASLRVARLGWLQSQAKLPLHDGWRRTWQMCHCAWNVKSTIRKAELPQHNKPGSPWQNCSLPTTWQLHLCCTAWALPD